MKSVAVIFALLIPHTLDGFRIGTQLSHLSCPRGNAMDVSARITRTDQGHAAAMHNVVLRGMSSRQVVVPGTASNPSEPNFSGKQSRQIEHTTVGEDVLQMGIDELYEYGKRLRQTRQYTKAAVALEHLLALHPAEGKAWMQLAHIYKQMRNARKAEATLRRAIDACPDNALLRQALADLCRKQKRYDEAREHFRRAMLIDPQMQSIYDSWGRMESNIGRHAVAASLISRGIAIQPTARLYHALAIVQDTRGKTEDARAACLAGLQLPDESSNPQLLHARGMVEARAGEFRRARKLFLLAIEAHPTFTMAHLALGQLEEQLGNYEAARRHFGHGATLPQSASKGIPAGRRGAVQLWQAWARMERRLGRSTAALRLYERASRWYGHDEQLMIEWAKLLTASAQYDEARPLFDKLLRLPNPRPYTFQCCALMEQSAGNSEQARALFKRGAALNSTEFSRKDEMIPLLHAWAVFEWKEGCRSRARKLFERAETSSQDSCGWLYQWRARFEADGGNVVLARHYYARAVNAAPRDSSAWRMWGEMEQSLNQTDYASAFFRRSVEVEAEDWLLLDGGSPLKRRQGR